MKQIPVTFGFNGDVIGMMTIDPKRLPASPEFCFSIAGNIKSQTSDGVIVGFDLTSVAVQFDHDYLIYLKQKEAAALKHSTVMPVDAGETMVSSDATAPAEVSTDAPSERTGMDHFVDPPEILELP